MPVVEDILWKHPGNPGMIVVTSHAAVTEDGRLALSYGPGQEAVRRIPQIEYEAAEAIRAHAAGSIYGFLPVRPYRPAGRLVGFGLFQTRLSFADPPDLDLIQYSMEGLRQFASAHPEMKIRMNFPGVGEGSLSEDGFDGITSQTGESLPVEEVTPLLLPLPPSVTLCHQGEVRPCIPSDFTGFKAVYIQVEAMLHEGHVDEAIEYLVRHGFDIQSAFNQVQAVQRLLRERVDAETLRRERLRRPHHSV